MLSKILMIILMDVLHTTQLLLNVKYVSLDFLYLVLDVLMLLIFVPVSLMDSAQHVLQDGLIKEVEKL